MKQHRVTCGVVAPPSVGDAIGAHVEAQCLVRAPGSSNLDVQVRFLHLATRREEGLEWDEASERVVTLQVGLADGCVSPIRESFRWPGFQTAQRTQESLRGDVELLVEPVGVDPEVFKVTVVVANTTGTPCAGLDQASVLRHSLVSAQILVEAPGGRLVSLTDVADEADREAARQGGQVGPRSTPRLSFAPRGGSTMTTWTFCAPEDRLTSPATDVAGALRPGTGQPLGLPMAFGSPAR